MFLEDCFDDYETKSFVEVEEMVEQRCAKNQWQLIVAEFFKKIY